MTNRPKPCFAERLWCSGLSSKAPRAIEAHADQIDFGRPGQDCSPAGLIHCHRYASHRQSALGRHALQPPSQGPSVTDGHLLWLTDLDVVAGPRK